MKNSIFLILFSSLCWLINGQNYLQEANNCFEKGDYECAMLNYHFSQIFKGRDMSMQIQKTDECFRNLIIADEYFKEKEYLKARDRYKIVLNRNPKDLYAKKQYEGCEAQLSPGNFTETSHSLNLEMIYVQGGTFIMGCTPEQGDDCCDKEKLAHQVTVNSFYISKYEVTQAQWETVMGNNPSSFKGDGLPVENVSWHNVQEFIRQLNIQTGKQYRLPTEAEWEFAARGGKKSKGYKYSGNDTLNIVAWYDDNSGEKTHAVGSKLPNELDIYDMSGNVWEWCNDWYGAYAGNPQNPTSGSNRVLRGGSWVALARAARVSFRIDFVPDYHYNFLGFRLACSSK
ncbi:MAG: formylglycine-generating enzyme family protein [Candidatus Azobacteroides sp.]|nr:formylglycine-generating enzyme family protein [Candidatus Azobacteroides sp.]